MRISLSVPRLVADPAANMASVLALVRQAADDRADLALFPEGCLTGFVLNDEPGHDLALGVTVPGPEVATLGRAAAETGVWIGIGMFERAGGVLYDTAVLMAPDSRVAFRYRRISPGWHKRGADPQTYGHGSEVDPFSAPFGKVAFLICGDLFDDRLLARVRLLGADLVLVPIARSFDDGRVDERRWEAEEKQAYIDQAARLGTIALIVNSLSEQDGSFGGALAVPVAQARRLNTQVAGG